MRGGGNDYISKETPSPTNTIWQLNDVISLLTFIHKYKIYYVFLSHLTNLVERQNKRIYNKIKESIMEKFIQKKFDTIIKIVIFVTYIGCLSAIV